MMWCREFDNLSLTKRSRTCLVREEITVGTLLNMSTKEIRAIRGVGQKSAADIIGALYGRIFVVAGSEYDET